MATTATTPPTAELDVLVIGAGQAGLALAFHLAHRDLRFLVVDAAPRIGAVWRARWDSLRLFTPAEYDALPGTPGPGAAAVPEVVITIPGSTRAPGSRSTT